MINDKKRLKILSDAIRKMAIDAYNKEIAERPLLTASQDFKQRWIENWIDKYLSDDLLES